MVCCLWLFLLLLLLRLLGVSNEIEEFGGREHGCEHLDHGLFERVAVLSHLMEEADLSFDLIRAHLTTPRSRHEVGEDLLRVEVLVLPVRALEKDTLV